MTYSNGNYFDTAVTAIEVLTVSFFLVTYMVMPLGWIVNLLI